MVYSALTDTCKKGRVIFVIALFVSIDLKEINEKSYDHRNWFVCRFNEQHIKQS